LVHVTTRQLNSVHCQPTNQRVTLMQRHNERQHNTTPRLTLPAAARCHSACIACCCLRRWVLGCSSATWDASTPLRFMLLWMPNNTTHMNNNNDHECNEHATTQRTRSCINQLNRVVLVLHDVMNNIEHC